MDRVLTKDESKATIPDMVGAVMAVNKENFVWNSPTVDWLVYPLA